MEEKEEIRFSTNVEVVSQALRQRSGREGPEREARILYRKFVETRQEPVRLAVALRGFFLEEGVSEEERGAYSVYLKRRFRPAVRQLIEEDAADRLEKLKELGWFDALGRQQMDDFLGIAREKGKTAALVWLLHLKEALRGYGDREFDL